MNALTELIGADVECVRCQRSIGRVLPFVSKGQLRAYGLRPLLVHVAFDSQDALAFRHGYLDECVRAPVSADPQRS